MQPDDQTKILVAVGADRAIGKPEFPKWRKLRRDGIITVAVGRGEETHHVLERFQSDLADGLVANPAAFFYLDQEAGNLSSSQVREELVRLHQCENQTGKERIANTLVERNFLHPLVASYIVEHEDDLYFSNTH
ncbi:MAG: hypothetical protein KDA84_28515 [Planctomycetaceae bacterium]|nr:hypothetical protein [Planctomycetaceae bacterium]